MASVNIAVCGKFHYHNYINYIHQAGWLNRFYYSHKLKTNATALQVPQEKLVNVWVKEYLTMAHLKVFNWHGTNQLFPYYHDLWQALVLSRWKRADIFHTLLHGTSQNLIKRAKADGSVIIGEPVNSHPEIMLAILNEEYQQAGLEKRLSFSTAQKRLLEEIESCDFLLVGSDFLKKSFVGKGFDPDRIFTIPYGVDLSRFYPLIPEEKTACDDIFRVICVAQITFRKGIVHLLEAWKRLNLPKAELILIGAVHEEMQSVLARYDGLFTHIPSVPNHQLRQYYGRAHLFVLPSLEDGFAYVVAEAMACGLPVVTTTNTGAAELIEAGKQGFVVPIRSSEAIAEKIELLYGNRDLQQQMAEAALQKSQTDLGWEQYALKLSHIYRATAKPQDFYE